MSKIFILNLHRSATKSTAKYLHDFGYRTVHWGRMLVDENRYRDGTHSDFADMLRPAMEHYDAFADVPFNVLYKEWAQIWPGSKYILVYRDVSSWISSVRKHVGEREFDPFEAIQYHKYLRSRPRRLSEVSDNELEEMHTMHINAIKARLGFSISDDILVSPLNEQTGVAISGFLGIPGVQDFPIESSRTDFTQTTYHIKK